MKIRKKTKDFSRKKFKNPFFKQKNNKTTKRNFRRWIYFVTFIGLLLLVVYLFSSARFEITNTQISGNEYIKSDEIQAVVNDQLNKSVLFFFKQKNIFLLDKSELRSALANQFVLEKVSINKNLFNQIIIEITEKTNYIILVTNNNKYYLDTQGQIIRSITDQELETQSGENTTIIRTLSTTKNRPIVYLLTDDSYTDGQSAIDSDDMSFLITLNQLATQYSNLSPQHYVITNKAANELELITLKGWKVLMKTDKDPNVQLNVLQQVLQETYGKRDSWEYIDVRYDDKVFIK